MSLTQTQLAVGRDLYGKCAKDVLMSMIQNMNLCDDGAQCAFVGCAGPISSGMALAHALSNNDHRRMEAPTVLADQALFALLFAWHARRPGDDEGAPATTSVHDIVNASKRGWEFLTNKTFDASWLTDDLQKALS